MGLFPDEQRMPDLDRKDIKGYFVGATITIPQEEWDQMKAEIAALNQKVTRLEEQKLKDDQTIKELIDQVRLLKETVEKQSIEISRLTKELEKEKKENKQLKEKYEKGKAENVSVSSTT